LQGLFISSHNKSNRARPGCQQKGWHFLPAKSALMNDGTGIKRANAGKASPQRPNLSSSVWTSVSTAPVVINGQNTVTNPISGTQQFFRLSQ
jgi:hypothetical protein